MGRRVVRPGVTTSLSCEATGCSVPTTGTKPFCPEHVVQMPYAVMLIEQEERSKSESASGGKVTADGPLVGLAADSLVQHLGRATVDRLRVCLNVSKEKTDEVVRVLQEAGLVTETLSLASGKRKRVVILRRDDPKLAFLTRS